MSRWMREVRLRRNRQDLLDLRLLMIPRLTVLTQILRSINSVSSFWFWSTEEFLIPKPALSGRGRKTVLGEICTFLNGMKMVRLLFRNVLDYKLHI